MNKEFEHILPQVGLLKITLFPPAEELYERLHQKKEIARLNGLRHLGALSHALPGARLARWDYSVALLYYSEIIKLDGFNSKFRIGTTQFSSTTSALQCLSLFWNIGHLPGTFAAEKGVCRLLKASGKYDLDDLFSLQKFNNDEINKIKNAAKIILKDEDYFSVSRILSVLKILQYCDDENDFLYKLTVDFLAPFALKYENHESDQWNKISKCFSIIRHLSYLTVDSPFSGHRWAPNIPDLLGHHLKQNECSLLYLHDKISEILSPVEKNIYDSMYHSAQARKEMAVFADAIEKRLYAEPDPLLRISEWMKFYLLRDLKLGRIVNINKVHRCLSISLRSHFSYHPDSSTEIERKLKSIDFSHPTVFKYKSWNSDALAEPDETIIDIIIDREPSNADIGNMTYWFISEFDNFKAIHTDQYELMRKGVLESAYSQILSKAVETLYPDVTVQLDAWNLNRWGLFNNHGLQDNKGAIWASSARLNDKIIDHILRDRTKKIRPEWMDQYCELLGLKALRSTLQREWRKSTPRCRWLVVTASVTFRKNERSLIEYDGGLLRISARNGKLTWYGLESKNGSENPEKSLRKRLKTIDIKAEIHSINKKYAYAKINL